MTNYTLTYAPAAHSLSVINNDESFTSITGAVQVLARAGARWHLTMNWRRAGADARALRAYLGSLQGMRNRAIVPLSKLGYIRGGTTGTTATVHGSHISGQTTITLRGLTANTTNVLMPGDFLEVGGSQLVQMTSALSSTGSPNTRGTANIWPPLNRNRADGTLVNLSAPGGIFIMTNDFGFAAEPMPATNFWYSEITAEFVEDVTA